LCGKRERAGTILLLAAFYRYPNLISSRFQGHGYSHFEGSSFSFVRRSKTMKTIRSHVVVAARPHADFLPMKFVLVAVVIALLFAALPAANASAAQLCSQAPTQRNNFAREWSSKMRLLDSEGLFYNQVRLYPADFEDLDDLALAQLYIDKYGVALRQANTVVFNHTGFDISGRVINETQACESVHELGMYLKMMRGFKVKMAEINAEALRLK
jgi:hypothetical protein